MRERSYRSVAKAVSYRTIGTTNTFLISLLITGELKMAASIGVIEVFAKIGVYYFHERAWNKIKFGRIVPKDDYQI